MSHAAPVEAPGQDAIQPCGFLLGLSDDWIVQHASANCAAFLGVGPDDADRSARPATISASRRSTTCAIALPCCAIPMRSSACSAAPLHDDERLFDLSIHRSGSTVVLEGQPSTGKRYGDVTATVTGMVARLDGARDLAALLTAGARQIRALTGFDRVSIIRFGDEGAGTVVAECTRASLGTATGSSFAADPAARARYRRRRLHVIDDVGAAPVAVLGDPALAAAPLDLSLAMLRAPSERTGGDAPRGEVGATMTLSLVTDGQLWGLIDCQHHFARSPGFERRSMADLFAQMFAMRIEILELKAALGR